MRKNKFFNPLPIKILDANDYKFNTAQLIKQQNLAELQKDMKIQQPHPLINNKIYFPSTNYDKFMPYKIEIQHHKRRKNNSQLQFHTLYSISERSKSKNHNPKSNLIRHNKSQFQISKNQKQTRSKSKSPTSNDLLKYKTIQLKNLPNVNSTISGNTIYRSKNIKSVGKLNQWKKNSIKQRQKSLLLRRTFSVRNQQPSNKLFIKKNKNHKQSYLKLSEKNKQLVKTYFSTHQHSKTKTNWQESQGQTAHNALTKIQEKEQPTSYLIETVESYLTKRIIFSQLYSNIEHDQQQYFI